MSQTQMVEKIRESVEDQPDRFTAKIVRIRVQGGVIQDVDLPKGVRAVVHDYDVVQVNEEELVEDEQGNLFLVTVWE